MYLYFSDTPHTYGLHIHQHFIPEPYSVFVQQYFILFYVKWEI